MFNFIVVDPASRLYGRAACMYASDLGLCPCPYGNHISTIQSQGIDKINPVDFYRDDKIVGRADEASYGNSALLINLALEQNEKLKAECSPIA